MTWQLVERLGNFCHHRDVTQVRENERKLAYSLWSGKSNSLTRTARRADKVIYKRPCSDYHIIIIIIIEYIVVIAVCTNRILSHDQKCTLYAAYMLVNKITRQCSTNKSLHRPWLRSGYTVHPFTGIIYDNGPATYFRNIDWELLKINIIL